MCQENLYAKMEKLEAQIYRCTRQGLKVMPCGSIGSDCNPIRTVIFSCLTKTDIAIGLAMFCKQRSFGTPRTVHHAKSYLKLSFYRSIRIYRVDFEKI